MTTFHIVTLFPESLESYLDSSLIRRAQEVKKIAVKLYNPRDFTKNKHRKVDGRPFGGGPGMVLEAEPVLRAVEKARGRKKNVKIVLLGCGGKEFNAAKAEKFAKTAQHIILIAGHYEGVDARVKKALKAEELSIGPYVLTGGELPALVMLDAVARFIPGVLGKIESLEGARVSSSVTYTRPPEFVYKGKKYRVPPVLRSGDHKKIDAWRKMH